jgi:hypothetical protein
MRKLLTSLFSVLVMFMLHAQVPNQLNYQGVARKANGHGIPNQAISVRLSIHDVTPGGPVVYGETRSVTTNAFGLFTVAIGSPGATGVIGSIGTVNWGTGNKFLQVELDPDGGSSFTNLGTAQLLSVPYALFAGGAPPVGPAGGDLTGTYPNPTVARIRGVNVTSVAPTTNYILGFDGTNWTPTSLATHPDNYWRMLGGNIYNANGGNVGIGLTTPTEKLQVNGNIKTLGFIMPTGAGAGKFLVSDGLGVGSWTSTIAATSIVLPYKDSAASTTAHIFHIIQTSPTSSTGALYGVTRSSGANAFATGGQVSSPSAPTNSAGVRGENLGNGVGVWGNSNNFYGVYGFSNTSSGVFGQSNSGAGYLAGVFGYATNFGGNGTFGYATRSYAYGVLGIADSSTGVWGQTNSATYAATVNDGVGVYGVATRGGIGVYGTSFSNNAARFENTNAANTTDALLVNTNSTSNVSAVHGFNGSGGLFLSAKKGMWGESDNGVGIFGTSSSSVGIFGASNTSAGVEGVSLNGISGVYALHYNTGYGLYAQSVNGVAGRFFSDNSSNVLEASTTGTGRSGFFENTNPSNASTNVEVTSNGTGRAIVARSNYPGFVNAGVIDALTTTYGGNAVFGRGLRAGAWGVYGLSDSSAGVAGVGYLPGSVGVYGQGWMGTAGQFVIDNSLPNKSNTVEISNSQSGKGVFITLSNPANNAFGLDVDHNGSGIGVHSNSNLGMAGKFENTNASNTSTTLDVESNGTGRAIVARSNFGGFVNAGVVDALTTTYGGNAIYGRGLRAGAWGVYGLSDSSAGVAGVGYLPGSAGVYGQGWMGTAGQFVIDNSLPNTSNTVEISNSQTGKGLQLMMTNASNVANGIDVSHAGSGIGIHSNSNMGIAGRFENTNASNGSITLDVRSNGTGPAIWAQSNLPGPVNAGVITGISSTYGSNAIFGRATRTFDWGVVGVADSSIATVGLGYYAGSVGIYGQSYRGTAAQFVIDNSLPNTSNTVEVSNSQSGNGVVVNLTNPTNLANAVDVSTAGSGNAVFANSNLGIAGNFQNTNAANANDVIFSTTNGMGRAMEGFITNTTNNRAAVRGETNGLGYGVAGIGTNDIPTTSGVYGLHTGTNGNGVIGWGTKSLTFGVIGHADSSIAVYAESGYGNAGYFYSYNAINAVPALYSQTAGLSNAASFFVSNNNNTADAVTINRVGAGRSLMVSTNAFNNVMNYYDVITTGKQTVRVEGNAGLGLLAHAGGTFNHLGVQRVGVGAYGQADSVGSEFNYGLVGNAKGGTLENAGVVGWIGSGATGSNVNAAIYGVTFGTSQLAGLFNGDVQVTGTLSKGAGTFKIDHPQDPANKYLIHSFVESPDMMNVYNGNVVTDVNGKAVVDLPGYFEAENKDFKYQLTVIGQFAQAIIGDEIKNNQFTILTDKPNVKVSWQVTGVRNDKFAQQHPIVAEVEKTGSEKGKYLYPELYGESKEKGITFMTAALPRYSSGENAPTSSMAQLAQNKIQEQVNRSVEQKRRMLNNQEEQFALQTKPATMNVQQQKKLLPTAAQKAGAMFASATQQQQPSKAEQPQVEQKQAQLPTEKTKQLLSTVNAKENNASAAQQQQQQQPKSNVAQGNAEKIKQLVNSTAVPSEQPSKTTEKPGFKKDSITVNSASMQAAQQKSNSAGSIIENKKLSSTKVKVPGDGEKKQ